MFTAALFITAKTWKQPIRLLTEEWIKNTMEYYSARKRNETTPFAELWMDPETVIQKEVSQREINKCHITLLICGI